MCPPEVDALLTLVSFTRDRTDAMRDDDDADRLLMLTTMRSNNTALAIVHLLALDSTEQAQMLCRSLFEDMVVVHWLVMQEDTAFLVERFFDSQDAIALAEHDFVTDEMRLPHDLPPSLGDLQSRRDELRKSFGTSAQHSWWGIDRDGKRRTLADVVHAINEHPNFAPRLSGGREPALANAYSLTNKWANQQLHHTPEALPFGLTRDGGVVTRDRESRRRSTAFTAFWIFGQTIYVQYWYGAHDAGPANEFQPLFLRLMQDAFAGGMSEEDVVAALTELRDGADS
jgi:uncharacterized protein DUF5677